MSVCEEREMRGLDREAKGACRLNVMRAEVVGSLQVAEGLCRVAHGVVAVCTVEEEGGIRLVQVQRAAEPSQSVSMQLRAGRSSAHSSQWVRSNEGRAASGRE